MKSMMKKKTLVLCSTLAAIACSAAFVTPVIFSYAETTTLSETKGNFYVVDGASVKKDSSAGIRFTTVVGKAYYENVMEADPTAEFHTEIYSALTDSLLQDVTYTKGLKYRENGAYTMDASAQTVDGYEYHVAITYDSIDDVSVKLTLGYDMYVKSYVEVNGDKIYAESNETVRSMKDVAELASEDGEEGLEKYYADVTENDSVVYHEQAGDNSVAVTGLPADTTETGELTAYIGGTALTDATFAEGKVTFGADTLAKLKPGANYQLTVLGANKGVFVAPFTSVTNVLTQDNFVSALYASGVVSDGVFAATDESSVAAVAKARNTYFVMEEDVTLDKTAYGTHSQSFWNAVYLIGGRFMGTLNAQGHKLTCNFVDPNLAGVFRYLDGTIRNLNYEMNSTYTVSAVDTRGFFAFAFTATTVVENCRISVYTKATSDGVTSVTDSKDSAFIVGACHLYNTGIIRNCILENKTYDPTSGKMVDKEVWYSSINAPVENCVFISTLDKLMKPNASAAHPQYTTRYSSCYKYATLEDFIKGNAGYAVSGADHRDSNATHTAITGAQWGALDATEEWTVKNSKISLCGQTVYPTDREITATVANETLSVADTGVRFVGEYNVFVGETKIGSFVGDTFNVVAALEKASKIAAGENEILVTVKSTDGEASATATVKVYGIDQTNFVTTVRTASANVSASYYIMIGDVTLGEADFAVGKGSGTFVSGGLYVALDGNGHTLKVEGEFTDTKKSALFYDVFVPVKNLVFKYNVTRTATQTMSQACFAQNMTKTATVVNCYMEANVTPMTDGEVATADVVMFNHLIGNSVNSTVISVNVLDKDGAATGKGAVTNICNGGPVLTVAFINADTTAKLAINGANGFANTSYYYTSLANFIAGNGQVSNAANTYITSLTWTATTDKAYAGWDTTVWTIDSTGIKLCGVAVYTVA